MDRKITVLLVACLCLLAACASLESNNTTPLPPEQDILANVEYEAPVYQFEPSCTACKRFHPDDDENKEVARYTYVLCTLSVSNLEEISPEDKAAAERNTEAFNTKMNELLSGYIEHGTSMGNDALTLYAQGSSTLTSASYYDDVSSLCYLAGDVISVQLNSESYAGGAHPNHYTSSYLFDLRTGQFIDPTQLAEDVDAFRTGVAALLLEKAEAQGSDRYWPEYAEIISRWNESAVLFDEDGMLVHYSPYDLGPYVIGEVVLRLNWEELAALLGPSGLQHLGVQIENSAGE